MLKDICATIQQLGLEHDSHESDLYVRCVPGVTDLIKESGWRYRYFRDAEKGELWVEVPFAYTPFWEDAIRRSYDNHNS